MTTPAGVAPGAHESEPTSPPPVDPAGRDPGDGSDVRPPPGSPPDGAGTRPPPPAPPPGLTRDERRHRRWTMAERLLAVLAAALGVAAGVLGVWGTRASTERDELEATADSLVEERNDLSDDLSQAHDRIDQLETEATSTTTTTTPDNPDDTGADAPGTVTPGAAGIFRQTGDEPVTFAAGYGIDLDGRDPNWGVGSGGDISLSRHSDGLSLFIPSRTIALVDEEPSYADCDAQTVLQDSFSAELTVVGQRMCIRTLDDRWAYVEILGLDPGRETVTLHIVVWTLQTD